MNRTKFVFGGILLCLTAAGMMQAQATRTWVSGVGDDANPCSRTAPCKTFAGAISKTAAGGEIDALDPGGFGTVTITKAITLDGGSGQAASILASASNGIIINAGINDFVTIRNLSITGANSGLSGIKLLAAKALHVEHCIIQQFTSNGIDIEPNAGGAQIYITDTISQDNTNSSGLYAIGPGSYIQLSIDNSRFDNNGHGLVAADYTRISVRNSAASGNTGIGFAAQANSGMAVMSIANSTAANNSIGITAGNGSTASTIRVAGTSLFLNTNGFVVGTNGTIASFGNNTNSGSGAPNASLALQ